MACNNYSFRYSQVDLDQDYDSILTSQDTNLINTTQYYATGKGMPDHGIPVAEHPYVVAKDDNLIGGMLLLAMIMAIVLYRSRTEIVYRMKEFFSTKRSYSEANINENSSSAYSLFVLTSTSALSLSLVLFDYIAIKEGFYAVLGIPYWLFAGGYMAVMLFVYVKAWLYALVNWTFFGKEEGTKWLVGYLHLTALTAFAIFPLSLIVVTVENTREVVTWAFLFVFLLYELLLLFKMFVNFEGKKYGYLLIFLYFCSVELIPAIVMSRITQWAIDSIVVKNLLY